MRLCAGSKGCNPLQARLHTNATQYPVWISGVDYKHGELLTRHIVDFGKMLVKSPYKVDGQPVEQVLDPLQVSVLWRTGFKGCNPLLDVQVCGARQG